MTKDDIYSILGVKINNADYTHYRFEHDTAAASIDSHKAEKDKRVMQASYDANGGDELRMAQAISLSEHTALLEENARIMRESRVSRIYGGYLPPQTQEGLFDDERTAYSNVRRASKKTANDEAKNRARNELNAAQMNHGIEEDEASLFSVQTAVSAHTIAPIVRNPKTRNEKVIGSVMGAAKALGNFQSQMRVGLAARPRRMTGIREDAPEDL
jgi:hypothetical protein